MLRDFPVRAMHYEAGTDEVRLEVGGGAGATRAVKALLLLDAQGFLVGVDLGGEEIERAVVLVGPFESVERTVEAPVVVTYGAGGEPVEVRVAGAKGAVRGGEPSPYLR